MAEMTRSPGEKSEGFEVSLPHHWLCCQASGAARRWQGCWTAWWRWHLSWTTFAQVEAWGVIEKWEGLLMHQVQPHSLHFCLSVGHLATSRPLLGQKPHKLHYASFQGCSTRQQIGSLCLLGSTWCID